MDDKGRLGLTGRAIDDIKRHQEEDRGAWYDYDENDFMRKLQRAIADRDMLLAEIEHLNSIIAALDKRPEPADWTQNEEGRSNSSRLFLLLVDEIDHMIYETHNFRSPALARLIVAQLAHKWTMAPTDKAFTEAKQKEQL